MTQKDRIIEYMKAFGSITTYEAFAELGITKLTTRISELRSEGIAIRGTKVDSKNRFGEPCSFMRYTLAEGGKNGIQAI